MPKNLKSFFFRQILVFGIALCLFANPTKIEARQGGNFGLGLVGGIPSGVSGKLWLNEINAIDFIFGWDLNDDRLNMNGDYVWHDFSLFTVPEGKLPLYYGMGPYLALDDNSTVGIRGVVGIEYLFAKAPLDAFFEIGPRLDIIPGTNFDIDAGLGMRFFF